MMMMLIFVNDKIVHNLVFRCDIEQADKVKPNWVYSAMKYDSLNISREELL